MTTDLRLWLPTIDGWVLPGHSSAVIPPFVLRTTKPTAANVGAGRINGRPFPTITINPGDSVPNGTWSGDTLSISSGDFKDRIVNGRVALKGTNQTCENCYVKGDPTRPVSAASQLIDTQSATNATVRYCTVRGSYLSFYLDGIGRRNATIEYCDISGVTDAFDPQPPSGGTDCKLVIRGNYVHDLIFRSGDPEHSPTPLTRADGTSLSPSSPYYAGGAGTAWTHCDVVQVESDPATGINIYGNNFQALWDPVLSQQPLPVDTTGATFIKELSCFMLNGGRNLIIEDNWLGGGEQCVNNADPNVTGVIHRNKFDPTYMMHSSAARSSYYALMLSASGIDSGDDGTTAGPDCNVWEDTGLPVLRR